MAEHPRPAGAEPPAKKTKKAAKHELPTRDEQKQLQQMEILMRSNLLTLQTTELLNEVSTASKFQSKRLTEWLELVKADLVSAAKNTCANREISASWVSSTLPQYALDFHNNSSADEPMCITYAPPTAVEVVGSMATNTATAPLYNIDVCVTMPASLFSSRDLLNHVYFDKRKLFLAGLRKSLEQINKKLGDAPRYKNMLTVLFKGDERKPLLQFQPAHSDSVVVRIIPALPDGVFKASQLRDEKNNVRPAEWMRRLQELKKSGKSSAELDKETLSLPPTPEYNRAILEDLTVLLQAQILQRTLTPFDSVCEALVLFKVWLTQRELRLSPEGVDGHMAALLFGFLVQTQRLSPQAAPLSLFQAALAFLSTADLATHAMEFSSSAAPQGNALRTKSAAGCADDAAAALLHPLPGAAAALRCNALWRVSAAALRALQSEAARSLAALQAQEQGVFHALFLAKRGFFERYDAFLSFSLPRGGWAAVDDSTRALSVSLSRSLPLFAAQRLDELLSRALGDRVTALGVALSPPAPQRVGDTVLDRGRPVALTHTQREGETESEWRVLVGVVFDNEKSARKVDRGPSAPVVGTVAQKKAAQQALDEFRAFYGDKVQLRRFRDGGIVESVVWDCDETRRRVSLFENIARFVAARHCAWLGVPAARDSVSSLLCVPALLPLRRGWSGAAEQGKSILSCTAQAVEALDELRGVCVNKLSAALPVKIDTLAALCAELRYTALLPPAPHVLLLQGLDKESEDSEELRDTLRPLMGESLSLLARPLRVCVRFASSSQWPTEAEALEKCKNAFLLKMRSELAKLEISSVVHDGSLDVLYKGYAFRLVPSAGVDAEKNAFKGEREADGESAFALAHREWTVPPLHHNAVRHVQHAHACFGESVQLVTLWLARHNLSQHMSQRCVELLCANEFTSCVARGAPTTGGAAFVRVLQRLASHDWEDDPLLVDFSFAAESLTSTDTHEHTRALSVEQRNTVAMRLRSLRATARAERERGNTLPAHLNPAMYIVSSADAAIDFHTSLSHSGDVPERVVLHMIVNAAKHALNQLRQSVWDPESAPADAEDELPLQSVFSSDAVLRRCDALFHFHKALVSADADEGPQCARLQVLANMTNKQLLKKNLIVLDEDSALHPIQAQIVQKLRSAFGDEALFFWDETQGRSLGVLFKPRFKAESEFSVLNTKFRAIGADGKSMTANVPELLQQIVQEADGLLSVVRTN